MPFSDLDKSDQANLATEDQKVRGILTGLMQLVKQTDFTIWEEWSNQNVTPILGKLKPDDVLPNSTDLAGAQDLAVSDLDAVRTLAKQLYSMANENLALIVKAIGINA